MNQNSCGLTRIWASSINVITKSVINDILPFAANHPPRSMNQNWIQSDQCFEESTDHLEYRQAPWLTQIGIPKFLLDLLKVLQGLDFCYLL